MAREFRNDQELWLFCQSCERVKYSETYGSGVEHRVAFFETITLANGQKFRHVMIDETAENLLVQGWISLQKLSETTETKAIQSYFQPFGAHNGFYVQWEGLDDLQYPYVLVESKDADAGAIYDFAKAVGAITLDLEEREMVSIKLKGDQTLYGYYLEDLKAEFKTK